MNFKKICSLLMLIPFLFGCNPKEQKPIKPPHPHPSGQVACESVNLLLDNAESEINRHVKLDYEILPLDASDTRVSFVSSDENILKVDGFGIVETVGLGNASITVKTLDGSNKTDVCNFNVVPHAVKEELSIDSIDVDSIDINLPNKPQRVYRQEDIYSKGGFDYLNIYELSDFHGAVNYEVNSSSVNIGLSKMATYFETLRNKNKGGSIFLSAGDMFQGSAESNLTRGYLVNYSMNYMGFDAMTIGNHEFDWSDTWIKKNAELSYNGDYVPYLGANIIDNNTHQIPSFLKESTIIERGNYKIGIVGTMGNGLESSIISTNIAKYTFIDEFDTAKNVASKLKNDENCDFVIWLTHSSVENITRGSISKQDNIDAIFGGHAHVDSWDKETFGIPVVATQNYGRSLASISLKINPNSKTIENAYADITKFDTVGDIANNEAIDSIMEQYNVEIDKVKNIKLGYTFETLTNQDDGQLKNICADTIQKSAKNFVSNNPSYNIDPDDIILSLHNVGGGIRSNINAGEITYSDVYTPFPFDNILVLYKAKGRAIVNESRYAYYAMWHSYESARDIDLDKEYYVATTDFMALSKLGVLEEDIIYLGLVVRDEIAKYIYELNQVDPYIYDTYNFKSISIR